MPAILEALLMHSSNDGPRSSANHPVAILREEHRLMLLVVDAMEEESRLMLAGEPMRTEFWRRVVEFLEHFMDRLHHAKEEAVLFPELARLGVAGAFAAAESLSAEHAEGRRVVRTLLEALARRDASRMAHACIGFCRRERQHIAREEEQLLPLCLSQLAPEHASRLAQAFDAHVQTQDPTILARCRDIARFVAPVEVFETFAV
jgi:hemerythrin-like domain-containing protein